MTSESFSIASKHHQNAISFKPLPLEKASFTLWCSVTVHALHWLTSLACCYVVDRHTRSNILDLFSFNEILSCFVNSEFLKANVLLFLSLCELLSFIGTFQLCGLSGLSAMQLWAPYCHVDNVQMTLDQAHNACDGGLHIKCHTNKKQSRNFNSVSSA